METIRLISRKNGKKIGTSQAEFPDGTFATLYNMEHPALDGLNVVAGADLWQFYFVENEELINVNAEGIVPSLSAKKK
jgi:hypothetical protein